jgi:hypothetical protein
LTFVNGLQEVPEPEMQHSYPVLKESFESKHSRRKQQKIKNVDTKNFNFENIN